MDVFSCLEVWHVSILNCLLCEVYLCIKCTLYCGQCLKMKLLYRKPSEIDNLNTFQAKGMKHYFYEMQRNVSVHDTASCRGIKWELFLFQCKLREEVRLHRQNLPHWGQEEKQESSVKTCTVGHKSPVMTACVFDSHVKNKLWYYGAKLLVYRYMITKLLTECFDQRKSK